MSRVSRRNYLNLWARQGAEQQPSARLSDDVQMVQVIDDFSHLSPTLTNASAACSSAAGPLGAGNFSGVRLSAPPNRLLAVTEIQNQEAVNTGQLTFTDAGYTQAGGQPANLPWGGVPLLAGQTHGFFTSSPIFISETFAMLPGQTFATAPILVAPGSSLWFISNIANVAFAYFITWTELPA